MRFVGCCNCMYICMYVCMYVCVRGADILAQVRPIGVKVCTTVDLSSGQSFSPFGGIFRTLNVTKCGLRRGSGGPFLASWTAFDRKYLENGKSERYMSIRAQHQLDGSFVKMYVTGRHYRQNMLHFE